MRFYCFFFIFIVNVCSASIQVGIGTADITPPVGTPSAGYVERKNASLTGVHDPLSAHALAIVTPLKKIVLCSVDNLGFTYEMVQEIQKRVPDYELYLASSHTHSGGGCFLDIPGLDAIAGPYSESITKFYIDKTAVAIQKATESLVPAKIGIGYGTADTLSVYRSSWPLNVEPLQQVAVFKVTSLNNTPIACVFNYPVHPTVLAADNRLFSADFVGYARDELKAQLGTTCLFINGAQGDINPKKEADSFDECSRIGKSLASTVAKIWKGIETSEELNIRTKKLIYEFIPKGLPISSYKSEMNLLVFNERDAFLTIPGELSCLYDRKFKEMAKSFGFDHLSIFGLTNDAHGYIILPESYRHKTAESALSFGGVTYGDDTQERANCLFKP